MTTALMALRMLSSSCRRFLGWTSWCAPISLQMPFVLLDGRTHFFASIGARATKSTCTFRSFVWCTYHTHPSWLEHWCWCRSWLQGQASLAWVRTVHVGCMAVLHGRPMPYNVRKASYWLPQNIALIQLRQT
jgi:hypothetical protein